MTQKLTFLFSHFSITSNALKLVLEIATTQPKFQKINYQETCAFGIIMEGPRGAELKPPGEGSSVLFFIVQL